MFERRVPKDLSIHVYVLSSVIGADEKRVQWNRFVKFFTDQTQIELKEAEEPDAADFVFLATGGVEHLYISEFERMPRALYAPKGTNAFAAMNEIIGYLGNQGKSVLYYDEKQYSLQEFSQIARAKRLIDESKICLFGTPAPWLVASTPTREALQSHFRTTLEFVDWDILKWSEEKPLQYIEGIWTALSTSYVTKRDLYRACQLSSAMIKWSQTSHPDAISVGCFPLLEEHVSACLAVSDLFEEGIVAACENDICSAMAMLMVDYLMLSDRPPWMANLVDIDGTDITLQHCTVARSCIIKAEVLTHFESSANCAIGGSFQVNTPVTIFRLNDTFDRAFIAEGRIIKSGSNYYGCRTSATIRLNEPMTTPLGNHHILIAGRCARALRIFCKLFM